MGKLLCWHWWGVLFRFRFAPIFVLFDFVANPAHGLLGTLDVFFGREFIQRLLVWQLDVDGNPVGVASGLFDNFLTGFGNGFEMDVAAKVVIFAELSSNFDNALHREIRIANDTGAEKKPFNVIAFVKFERQRNDFIDGESRTLAVAGSTIDAVVAIVDTGVRHQDFEK